MTIKVVHSIKDTRVVADAKNNGTYVYIGRSKGPGQGKWGNPFTHLSSSLTLAKYHVSTREESIKKYEEWIRTQPELMSSLHELKGKTLGCWCKPLTCHGDILAKLVKEIE